MTRKPQAQILLYQKFLNIIIQLNLLLKQFLVFPLFSGVVLVFSVLLWGLGVDGLSLVVQAVQQVLITSSLRNAVLMLTLLHPSRIHLE